MPDFDVAKLSSPIPGMSLTTEPGSRPWEKPARYPHAEDALNYYISQLSSSERLTSLFDILENGFPVVTLVDSIIISGVMEGLHTIDVGVLISPALFQFIAGVASLSNVEYITGMEEEQTDNAGLISQAMKEARSTPVQDEEEPDELIEIAEEGIEEMHRGLMSRPEPEQGEE